jgi:hypothetical protein
MNDTVRPVFHGFEQIPLREYAERAYLDYSMYVVLDRALAELGQQQVGVARELRLGVAHRREALRVVGRAEVALPVDQRVAE